MEEQIARQPDGQIDPAAFLEAIDSGELNLQSVEHCHACILENGLFYLQRPAGESDAPMNLLKVIKIIYTAGEDGPQWGAWVQPWELSTSEDTARRDFIADPWHGHAEHPTGQRYNAQKPMREQTWSYLMVPLNQFQDQVHMNVSWKKPKGWNKQLNGGAKAARNVLRRNIRQRDHPKVRTFLFRWGEADARNEQ